MVKEKRCFFFLLKPHFETDGVLIEGLGGDGGVMFVASGFGDGEAQTKAAAGGASAVFAVEAVKETAGVDGGCVGVGVVESERWMAAAVKLERDGAIWCAVFAGVVQKNADKLADGALVAVERHVWCDGLDEGHALLFNHWRKSVGHFTDGL